MYLVLGILVRRLLKVREVQGKVNKYSANKEKAWQLLRGRPRAAKSVPPGQAIDNKGLD